MVPLVKYIVCTCSRGLPTTISNWISGRAVVPTSIHSFIQSYGALQTISPVLSLLPPPSCFVLRASCFILRPSDTKRCRRRRRHRRPNQTDRFLSAKLTTEMPVSYRTVRLPLPPLAIVCPMCRAARRRNTVPPLTGGNATRVCSVVYCRERVLL